jgi:radical SAM superfamily enzyme YgiQ (UPF0313 family)
VLKSVIGVTGPPLGLAYLASTARMQGDEVKIIDSLALDYTFGDIKREIKKFNPDFVGITAATSMIPDAYSVAAIAKQYNNAIKVAIGGSHVTYVPELTLRESPNIDYVIIGEGEVIFSNLLRYLKGKIGIREVKGLAYRNGNEIRINSSESLIKEVDSIPLPSLDLLPMERYTADGTKFGTIMTSRGCPYNCIFCSSSLQFGKIWRGHSAERVLMELKRMIEDYNIHEIEFLDDTFTLNIKRAIEISQMIKKERMDIRWSASARVNLFNEEVANAMRVGGAHTVYFGIESGNQKTLDFIEKGTRVEQSIVAVEKGNRAGLNTMGSFIIGFPYDTEEEVKSTISFAKKVKVKIAQFTIATPYPGTKLWNLARSKNLIRTMDWRKYTTLSPVMRLMNFTDESILKWLGRAYLNFYLRPAYLLNDLIKNHGFIFKRIISYYSKAMFSLQAKKTVFS